MIPSEYECPACGSPTFEALGQKNGFHMRSCRGCRSLAAAGDYSATGSLYEEVYSKAPPLMLGASTGLRRILERLESSRAPGRLLDYGFGAGDLMRMARDRGWNVSGIEYSDNARNRAEAEGFEVAKEASGLRSAGYDVVTMIEVIEHLPDARSALRNAFELLRSDGALFITTPNARGLNPRFLGLKWSVVGPPDHRVLFSSAGLSRLVCGAGFLVRSIRTEGLNPGEWRVRSGGNQAAPTGSLAPATDLNDRLEARRGLRLVKRAANLVLSLMGLGDTIKLMATRH